MPITSFTIDGVEVNPLLESLDIRETEGGVSTLSCDVESIGSPVFRVSLHDDVVVEEDGVRIFAGKVTQSRERGLGGPNLYDEDSGAPQLVTTITAEDHNRIPERVFVTLTIAAGTLLKAGLTALLAAGLSDQGMTLHASQVDGPALPALEFTRARASEVIKAFSDATGYLSRTDYDKALRMWAPGDLTAPFNIDENDSPARWTGDVEVENILGDEYANHVTVVVGPLVEENRVESFTGDGVTSTFDLTYTLTSFPYGLINRFESDGVTPSGGETFALPGNGAQWEYDSATNSITRMIGASESGYIYRLTFNGVLYLTGIAQDAGEIAANGLYQHVEQRDDATTQAGVDAIAAQILAERLQAGDQITVYETRYTAPTLRAGQQQGITATARALSGNYIVTDLSVRAETPATAEFASDGLGLTRKVTAKKNKRGKWQQTYHDWLGGNKGGGSVSINTGSNAPVAGGPGTPFTSVQFNRSGSFGGDAAFTYDEDADTVSIGDDHAVENEFTHDCGDLDSLARWDVAETNIVVVNGTGENGTNGIAATTAPYSTPWLVKQIAPTPADRVRFKWSQWIPSGSMPFTGFTEYVVAGVYYANGSTFAFSNRQVSINTTDDGKFYFLRGSFDGTTIAGPTTNPVWAEGEWNEVEVEIVIHDSAGSITLWRNGVEMLSATGLDTQALASAIVDGVEIVPQSIAGGVDAPIDNVEINVAKRNLLVGRNNSINGDDSLIVGANGALVGNRSVLLNLDGTARTETRDGALMLWGDFYHNGAAVTPGAPTDPTYLTVDDETGDLANSRRLVAGTNVAFDTSTPGQLAISSSGGGGGSGDSTHTAAYGSRPAASNAGDIFLPNDGFQIERDTGAAWVPWGPLFPFTAPVDGDFSWVNQGGASAVTTNGGIVLAGPADAGENLRMRVKAAPSTPYVITAAFLARTLQVPFHSVGLCWRDSVGGGIVGAAWGYNSGSGGGITGQAFRVYKWTNATTFSAVYGASAILPSAVGAVIWLRIADDGTNRIISWSPDGVNWLAFHTVSRTDFITPDQIGFFVNAVNGNYSIGMTLLSWKES